MATYYVDGLNGSDGNAGTSFGAAYATIGKAASSAVAGDQVNICNTATYTLGATVTWGVSGTTAAGAITITGANATGTVDGTRPLITSSTNSVNLFTIAPGIGKLLFQHLHMTHTAGTRGDGLHPDTSGSECGELLAFDLFIDGCKNGIGGGGSQSFTSFGISASTIQNCTNWGIIVDGATQVTDCYIRNNTAGGVQGPFTNAAPAVYVGNVVVDNGSHGIRIQDPSNNLQLAIFRNNICANNAGAGIFFDISGGGFTFPIMFSNNILYNNTTYGIRNDATQAFLSSALIGQNYNAFGANGTAPRLNMPSGTNDITLTASPFTNAASGDYSLNTTAGGGLLLRGLGFPGSFPGGLTTGFVDVGAVQSAAGGGPGYCVVAGGAHTYIGE